MSSKPAVTIYTDGGASPNPGPGGWGVVLIDERSGKRRELSGGEPLSTNNRMELLAAISGLEQLKERCQVALFTDSQYLRLGMTQWLAAWKRQNWKRKQGEILNLDLWKRLDRLSLEHEIDWHWIKGHAGHEHNERADALATEQIRLQRSSSGTEPEVDAEIFLKIRCAAGEGRWAGVVRRHHDERTYTGQLGRTTANRLDLTAAIQLLGTLPKGIRIAFYTGNDYLRRGASEWLAQWRRQGWKTRSGSPVKHADAWRQLAAELKRRQVQWPEMAEAPEEVVAALARLVRAAGDQ